MAAVSKACVFWTTADIPRRRTYANQQFSFFFFWCLCVPRRGTYANQQLLFLCRTQ